jgi:hypothetical protein
MLLDDEFLASASDDPYGSVIAACERMSAQFENDHPWSLKEFDAMVEVFTFIEALNEAGLTGMALAQPDLSSRDLEERCQSLSKCINQFRLAVEKEHQVQKIASVKSRMTLGIGRGFAYQFSEADVHRVQVLISELRMHIVESTFFDDAHRARILKRLEKLQSELHKKMSDLDRFWGLIGDAGVALGKFGTDAKPLVDRITEISQIVWNTQKQAEGLPSSTEFPLLSNNQESGRSNT